MSEPKIQLKKVLSAERDGGGFVYGWQWRVVDDQGDELASSAYPTDRQSAIGYAKGFIRRWSDPESHWHDYEEGIR